MRDMLLRVHAACKCWSPIVRLLTAGLVLSFWVADVGGMGLCSLFVYGFLVLGKVVLLVCRFYGRVCQCPDSLFVPKGGAVARLLGIRGGYKKWRAWCLIGILCESALLRVLGGMAIVTSVWRFGFILGSLKWVAILYLFC